MLSGTISFFNHGLDFHGENQDSRFKCYVLLRVGVSRKGRKIKSVAEKKVDADARVGQDHHKLACTMPTERFGLFAVFEVKKPCEECKRCKCQNAAWLRGKCDDYEKISEGLRRAFEDQLQEDLDEEKKTVTRLRSERDMAVEELRRLRELIAERRPQSQTEARKKMNCGKRAAKLLAKG